MKIIGTAPYVQHRFSQKAIMQIKAKHEEGDTAKRKKREKRDFHQEFLDAMYSGPKGERGIPANAFRAAFVDVCRTCGIQMTKTKQLVDVLPDCFDVQEMKGLVQITSKEKPVMRLDHVRNDDGSCEK